MPTFPENRCAGMIPALLHCGEGDLNASREPTNHGNRNTEMSLKHFRDLFGGGTAVGLSDGELLRRYAASPDGPAFEALVARHGPMVAATCRAVLRNHQDAEDAFQATFLVLARKAASIHSGKALGGWLHRVAYRRGCPEHGSEATKAP